jgi:hypothetical protein
MSVELETRVRRANLVSLDRQLERLYGNDLSHRLLRDVYSKKEGRMSEMTDRPESAVEDVPADEKAFRPTPTPAKQRSPAFVPAILTAVIGIGVIVALAAREPTPEVAQTPVQIAEAFMTALNAHDADAVRSLLVDDDAMVTEAVEVEDVDVDPITIEQQLEQEEVLGWTYHVENCVERSVPVEGGGTSLGCAYSFSNDISVAIGTGPYGMSRYDFVIVDGKIALAENFEYDSRFHEEAISAFGDWLGANHPEVSDIYYEYYDEANLASLKQFVPEFVAAMEDPG